MCGPSLVACALVLGAALGGAAGAPAAIPLAGGAGGLGFDDLRFSKELGAVLVPAGRTGRVDLLRGASGRVESLPIFDAVAASGPGHEDGTTSADAAGGRLFAVDRTTRTLAVVDRGTGRVVARAQLGSAPDYVRWVGPAQEVWVTEPDLERIETFRLDAGERPALTRTGAIPVPGGPESLVVDAAQRRAYTSTFGGTTFAVDIASRSIARRMGNRCRGARGLALDAGRALLFVGCAEGRAVALDLRRGGEVVGEERTAGGVDVIDYGAGLSHLYVPAATGGTLAILAVAPGGALHLLGTIPTARGAHCVAADDAGNAYVCDPRGGRVLVVRDPYPASR